MCKVSSKLKLCTCATDLDKLKHFWIFHRYVKGKNEIVIGSPIFPEDFVYSNDPDNQTILERLLNEENIFDAAIIPKSKDRLELSFTCNNYRQNNMTYGFEYIKSRWVSKEYDCFGWMYKHDEEGFGKIKNALERINKSDFKKNINEN